VQAYLQQRLGQYLTIATLNANLLRNLMTAWLVYDEQRQRYVNFDEAADLVEACKQQQQQQQQQAAAAAAAAAAPAAAAAAVAEGQQRKAPVITASIPLEKLLGVKAGASGSSSGRRQQQQQEREQLAGSGSGSGSGAAGTAGA
jgi:hypothetical protein